MTDRDDREDGGNSPVEASDNDSATTDADIAEAGEAEAAAEDESGDAAPAFALDRDADEGGTVEPHDEADVAESEDPAYDAGDLGLVSDDDALPWLESSDYDDIESVDAWRVTGFVVLGLLVLALLVGGIWYFTNRDGSGAPEADGSTIEAPDTPYKERPDDPGGKTFEGTGDMAPAVGEGESREGRLAEGSATPEPIASEPAKQEEAAAPTQDTQSTPPAKDNRIAVQVGAYFDKAAAEEGWRQIRSRTDALSGVEYRIVQGQADIGTVYRLQALPGDMAAARRLADALEADGIAAQIKR
ncbi:SPOR domain-containing protein [Citromicrobium sp. JLT1363]|uniref:SPOR domain-containing protein n=1 Tax=Citromicrobium sp. JLT1363 TaxID=517722 RepID=UPI000225E4DF|nr:SPOR domain-containing protein [Citromicrobium sp. JLT1363]